MAGPGRPPKPTHLKLISGNPGKRPLPMTEPGKPKDVAPSHDATPPSFVTGYGREEWQRVLPILVKLGRYDDRFRIGVAMYCQAFDEWRRALNLVRKHKSIAQTPNGYAQLSAYQVLVDRAHKKLLGMMNEFGLTLVAEVRVQQVQLDLFNDAAPAADQAAGGEDW